MDIIRRIWLPTVLCLQTIALAVLGWLVWDTRAIAARIHENDPATYGQDPDWVERLQQSIEDVADACR